MTLTMMIRTIQLAFQLSNVANNIYMTDNQIVVFDFPAAEANNLIRLLIRESSERLGCTN